MHRNVHYVLIGVIAAVFVLSVLARRFPHIDWLQCFRFERPYDPNRDRHLDTAWMPSADAPPRRDALRETLAEVRQQFRDFRAALPQLPKEQQVKLRRRSNVYAGVQLILLGVALPFGYHILSVMTFFSSVSRTENVFVFAGSGLCIALGITAIWRSGRD
jgi:hypothetical protein